MRPPPSSRDACIVATFSASVWIIITAATLVVLSLTSSPATLATSCSIYASLFLLLCVCYAVTRTVELQQVPVQHPCRCMRVTPLVTRICRSCGPVAGLDHHCPLIDRCVGARSYAAFFLLLLAGTLQAAWGAVACALVAGGGWRRASGVLSDSGAIIASSITAAVNGGCAVGLFGSLLVFHCFLLTQGVGTFDWLLLRSARALQLAEQREG